MEAPSFGLANQEIALLFTIEFSSTPHRIDALIIDYLHRQLKFQEFLDTLFFSNLEAMLLQLENAASSRDAISIYLNCPQSAISECPELDLVLTPYSITYLRSQKSRSVSISKQDTKTKVWALLQELSAQKEQIPKITRQFNDSPQLQKLLLVADSELRLSKMLPGLLQLEPYHLGEFVKLDRACLNGLQLLSSESKKLPRVMEEYKVGDQSIFEYLNHCSTKAGERLLKKWLIQPLLSVEHINQRLDIVQFFCENEALAQDLRTSYLRGFPDGEKLQFKLFKIRHGLTQKNGSLFDALKAQKIAAAVMGVSQFLKNSVGTKKSLTPLEMAFVERFVNPLARAVYDENEGTGFARLLDMIDKAIQLSDIPGGQPYVKPDFDEEMQNLYAQMEKVEKEVHAEAKRVEEELGLNEVKVVESGGHGLIMETKKIEFEKKTRNISFPHKVIGTRKYVLTFTTARFSELVSAYFDLKTQYKQAQSGLVTKVLKTLSSYVPLLQRTSLLMAELDVLCSFASRACCGEEFVRPIVKEGVGKIEFRHLRHPLLNELTAVRNDCLMRREDSRLFIITGPNMGGKSTYIRMVGIGVLLAQMGCYVPCSYAEFEPVDQIIARVGASDSNILGISTFQNEMNEVSNMIEVRGRWLHKGNRGATERSLAIIDELGRGTSTDFGIGIAKAVGLELVEKTRCFGLFATHFHELADLAQETSGVKNMYVHFQTQNGAVQMRYEVMEGRAQESCGINVLKMLDFPAEIIEDAEEILEKIEEEHTKRVV